MTMTFKEFLNEVTTDTAALDDPELKQELMRRMRASTDDQRDRLDTRMARDMVRRQRSELQQETDPRKKQLRRKKMTLQRQLDFVNQQLSTADEEGGENSEAA